MSRKISSVTIENLQDPGVDGKTRVALKKMLHDIRKELKESDTEIKAITLTATITE